MTVLWYEHLPGRVQQWEFVDRDIREFVMRTVDDIENVIGKLRLVGAYLHGSLAMGSFYRPKSDVDVLFVVDQPLPPDERRAVAIALADASDRRPAIGDVESSVVLRSDVASYTHPLAFQVHYSAAWEQRIRSGDIDFGSLRTDPDLAAHCTSVRARGVCLRGTPISEVFGPVPVKAFRESIVDDFSWIVDRDHMLEAPIYGVLNSCRVLQLHTDGWHQVVSKDEGGQWALSHVPQHHRPIIAQALTCYRSPEEVAPAAKKTHGHAWDTTALRAFRDYVCATLARRTP